MWLMVPVNESADAKSARFELILLVKIPKIIGTFARSQHLCRGPDLTHIPGSCADYPYSVQRVTLSSPIASMLKPQSRVSSSYVSELGRQILSKQPALAAALRQSAVVYSSDDGISLLVLDI